MNSSPASFFRLRGPLCQFTRERCILAWLLAPKHSSRKPNLPLHGNSSTFRNISYSQVYHEGFVTSKLGGKWPTSRVLMAQFSFFSSGNVLQSHLKAQSRKPQNKSSHDLGRTFTKPYLFKLATTGHVGSTLQTGTTDSLPRPQPSKYSVPRGHPS